jgi:hypothetical protein
MEFTNIESNAIEAKTLEAEVLAVQELNELQLLMVGGGNCLVIVG